MTNLEKAARLVLEVAELISADLVCDAAHHKKADRHGIGEPCPIQARRHHAFAALRQALEQPAQQRHIAYVCPQCYWTLEEQPASKPWVGLTPEERQACTQSPFTHENYLAIEAMLKEKNA